MILAQIGLKVNSSFQEHLLFPFVSPSIKTLYYLFLYCIPCHIYDIIRKGKLKKNGIYRLKEVFL
jgi:hypothetical protein